MELYKYENRIQHSHFFQMIRVKMRKVDLTGKDDDTHQYQNHYFKYYCLPVSHFYVGVTILR
jgi:hypothetical protein